MGWLTKMQKSAGTKDHDFTPAAESFRVTRLPNTRYPYGRSVKDGLDSNVVMAPVNWILRNFTEAELLMQRKTKGMWQPMDDHDVIELIDRPNRFYDGDLLWKATLTSYVLEGDAYWLKVRNVFGGVIQLMYLPHFLVEPKSSRDGEELISHYEYRPWWGAPKVDLDLRDVIHFRFGLDPRDMKHGLSPLKPLLREVFTDDEAANFSATILKNMGVPGGVIAPKDGSSLPNSDDVEEMREYMKKAFNGDRRGEWLVLGTPTETSQFGFDPNQLMLGNLRDIAEERVCAALGIPAAVVGFGSGLQSTKVGAPQPLSATLWTPTGPTTMGEVEVGQVVAIPDGWGRVSAVYPQGEQDIYRITFQDGSTAESTLDHLWEVKTPNQLEPVVEPLSEIASWSWWKLRRTTVPLQGVTEFAEQPTMIPPYVMGLLLADGTFRHNLAFSNANAEIVETMRERVPDEYAVTHASRHDYRISYLDHAAGRGEGNGTGDLNPFKDELRRLGLWMLYSHEKFVPDLYKYNSSRVRLELLRGILDGDGFVNHHGQPALEQTSERLADDVTWLVQSLGGYTLKSLKKADRSWREIQGRPMRSRHDRHHLSIVIEDGGRLFHCAEKREKCRPRKKLPTRKFRSVEFVRREEAQCIKIDGSLYLTDNFIVTHNTMKELRRLAWTSAVQPMQRSLARQASSELIPEFQTQERRFRLWFDVSSVPAFQEEETELARRVTLLVEKGLLRVDRGQEMLGLEVDDTQDVYLRPMGSVAIPADGSMPQPPPSPNGNGNGEEEEDETEEEVMNRARAALAALHKRGH